MKKRKRKKFLFSVRQWCLVIIICCLALLISSCRDNTVSKTGKVAGEVTDEKTSLPIEGVTVTYSGNELISKITNSEGKYEISLSEGKRDLTFTKEGYEPKTITVVVVQGETLEQNVSLTPKGSNPEVARVEVLPTAVTLKIGGTQQFTVKAYDLDNNEITNFTAELSVSPSSIGTISTDGTFTASEEGEGTLTATVSTKTATASITVEGNYPMYPPTLKKSWTGPIKPTSLAVYGNTLYVTTELSQKIQMYDLDGNLKGTIVPNLNGKSIRGIYACADGLYFGAKVQIQKYSLDGNWIKNIGEESPFPDYPAGGKFYGIQDLVLDNEGNMIVLEGSGLVDNPQRFQKLDKNGSFLFVKGSYGSGRDQFYYPNGLCVDCDNNIVISDCENRRIVKYDSNGNYLTEWSTPGRPQGIKFYAPYNRYYVNCETKIVAYSKAGKQLFSWDQNPQGYGSRIALDESGNIYVEGYDYGRITKYGY